MFLYVCHPCQQGNHFSCLGSNPVPPGVYGGSKCTCGICSSASSTTLEDKKEEMVSISKKEYETLKDNSLLLECLERGGVDNWEWYGEAMKEYAKLSE